MTLRTQKASWLVSGLLLVTVVLAGVEMVMAQPKSESPKPALDTSETTFELLGEQTSVNVANIAYTSDDNAFFDIYFACSSARGTDPLRFTTANDIERARSYFGDEKRYGKQFIKVNKYRINVRNIAYLESKNRAIVVSFNARILDAFMRLTLFGADAEAFREKMREFRM